jgi:hypothetical protein
MIGGVIAARFHVRSAAETAPARVFTRKEPLEFDRLTKERLLVEIAKRMRVRANRTLRKIKSLQRSAHSPNGVRLRLGLLRRGD